MLYINKVTNDPFQQMTLTGIPGINIVVTLQFMPRIQRWVLGVDDGATPIQGVVIVNSLNMLRQFKNNISYGICCMRGDGLDPYTLDDFVNQTANLYLLDSNDVAAIEQEWFT